MLVITIVLLLNGVVLASLWHMSINHTLDRLGEKLTRGVLKITPEAGYIISQYCLVAAVFLLDLLILYLYFRYKSGPHQKNNHHHASHYRH